MSVIELSQSMGKNGLLEPDLSIQVHLDPLTNQKEASI
jgi:hypothetical protein